MAHDWKSSPSLSQQIWVLLWSALLLLWIPLDLRAYCRPYHLQLVSVRRYYTLFLSSGQEGVGVGQPLLRETGLHRFRNFDSRCRNPVFWRELPERPYLEFRASVDERPVLVEKDGSTYTIRVTYPGYEEIEVRTDTLQRVVPQGFLGKVDFFEDRIMWGGWRPPIEDYWIVVDLGKMYAAYQQKPLVGSPPPGQAPAFDQAPPTPRPTPAFGLSSGSLPNLPPPSVPRSAPPPTFQQFLTSQVIQLLPAGYRIEGNRVWWHWKQIYDSDWDKRLHVEWRAWYR
ncbi:hypothetical protein [Methylacidimicrobium sp. B4]|uniref:hypothetical protein n=1 Tax=Methylacidimicrobium sp. B4 TaxID=2796139 RepID=UPI001A8C509E|nr:hypothetical protein [Methylacidimicrobium sp. B4]QSR85008.1 hypothetical protein MacB4_01680 [Methylacidimicrobium sp. B4]